MTTIENTHSENGNAVNPPHWLRGMIYATLGLSLVTMVIASGIPSLDAPWIQGDEHRFIANNPDVINAPNADSRLVHYWNIFTHYHEDLYQPIPILSYAMEWQLWGNHRVTMMRLTDVCIHAINGLLLWLVLRVLFRVFTRIPNNLASTLVAFGLAIAWCLHSVQVSAYAADMGRTHLLSAMFAMLSLLAYVRFLDTKRHWPLVAAFSLILLAQLSKPIVGWFAIIFLLEWQANGFKKAMLSWRVFAMLLIGLVFALITLDASHKFAMFEDISSLLFGDPVSRSLFSVWLYVTKVLSPTTLSPWYLPDQRSVWTHWTVIVGLGLTVLSFMILVGTLIRGKSRGIAVGLIWCWVTLLPVIGLVGARAASANDRYLYQPLIGIALAVGILLHIFMAWLNKRQALGIALAVVCVGTGIAVASVPLNRQYCDVARSTVKRAALINQRYPDSWRGHEVLAIAYEFTASHRPGDPNVDPQLIAMAEKAMDKASQLAEDHPEQFNTPHDRAAFYRRSAYRYLIYRQYIAVPANKPLVQIMRAHEIEPTNINTWRIMCLAQRDAGRWHEAEAAYQTLETLMREAGADAENLQTSYTGSNDEKRSHLWSNVMTEYGDLLLHHLGKPKLAIEKYKAALEHRSLMSRRSIRIATIGLALAEIRGGIGQTGFEIISNYLSANANDFAALGVLAEYHVRSHHWEDAERVYMSLLSLAPTHYRSLRGYHEVMKQIGDYASAAAAWNNAARQTILADQKGLAQIYVAWTAWSLACTDAPEADGYCDEVLAAYPGTPFACLGKAIIATRTGDLTTAIEWVSKADRNMMLVDAREYTQAALSIELMVRQKLLPVDALITAAAIRKVQGGEQEVRRLIEKHSEIGGSEAAREIAEKFLGPIARENRALENE